MKVVFIQPHWFDKSSKSDVKSIHSITPPLGILYLAACIRRDGHKSMLIDALAENLSVEQVKNRVLKAKPDIVAMTGTTPQISSAFSVIKAIKNESDIPIILGGPHATAAPLETMRKCSEIDILVFGEGELIFPELVNAIEKGSSLEKIRGIYLRKKGDIKFTGSQAYVDNLDELPFPARDLLKSISIYKLAPSDVKREPSTTMVTSRGCPFKCKYCNKAVFGSKYRFNSPEYVLDEIEYLIEKYKIREIKFWDDVFTIRKKRTEQICEEIKKRKLDLVWSCESRVDIVDYDILKKMKSAGCWQIDYGIESAEQKLLDRINKGIKIETAAKTIKLTKKAGISTRGYFILGLPGETIKSANKTIDFAVKSGLDSATFFVCVPYPGTELYDIAKQEGGIKSDDWSQYSHIDFEKLIYVPNTIKEAELKKLINKAYKKFYIRPEFVTKQVLNIRSVDDIKNKLQGLKVLLKGL